MKIKNWIPAFAGMTFVLLILGVSLHVYAASGSSPFEVLWDDAPVEVALGDNFELSATIRSPQGHYIYAEETSLDFVSLEGIRITSVTYPKVEKFKDQYFKKEVDVYRGDTVITVRGKVPSTLRPATLDLVANLAFRGCSPKVCFRPDEREVLFKINVLTAAPNAPSEPLADNGPVVKLKEKGGISRLLKSQNFGDLLERGLGLTLLIVFVAGLLTSLTPCVWPVIPVVLLFVGVHPHKRFWENFLLAATLVAGMVLVYSILGTVAVLFGKNLGFLFQHKIFLVVVVLFFLAMGLSMFGVFDIRLPHSWHHRLHKIGGEGYRGAFLAGMATGLVASPCSGPVLASILAYAAIGGDYLKGFVLLVIYGIGMGFLIVVLGACYGELAGKLKGGRWMLWVRRALGVILLFPAAFYMGTLFGWGASFSNLRDLPRIEWITNEPDALMFASKEHRPIMVEFGAKWCPPCLALDGKFFTRPDIVELSYLMVPLKVDATFNKGDVEKVINKYGVVSWPTVIFLNPDGKPLTDLQVNGYDPEAVEKGMREALRRSAR